MIKHIFSDLDGTLLNDSGQITKETETTIKEKGIPFTLVSARTPKDMAPIVTTLGLSSPQVAFNGGLIYLPKSKGHEIISEHYIQWELADKIIGLIQTYDSHLSFSFYDDDNWYTCSLDKGIEREASIGSQTPQLVNREEFFQGEPVKIFKIMLWIFDAAEMMKVKGFLNALKIKELSIVQSSEFTLEITDYQAQKSRGIDFILNHYQLNKEEVAAFGDGHNDIPMLKKVGHPVVMGNATEEVKAYGKYMTKKNSENGVSYGINTFF